MEQIILSAIMQHIQDNQVIRLSQHGQVLLDQLISFHDKVTHLVDEGNTVYVVYLGLIKAFGTVPHSIPLEKLAAHGSLLLMVQMGVDGCSSSMPIYHGWTSLLAAGAIRKRDDLLRKSEADFLQAKEGIKAKVTEVEHLDSVVKKLKASIQDTQKEKNQTETETTILRTEIQQLNQ
ncbi:hypothetical protein BTVI_53406 [Pitangus sulphuratus]|nr:hypothetical protein BTVI_53406 [Pitangus sulphuratus]